MNPTVFAPSAPSRPTAPSWRAALVTTVVPLATAVALIVVMIASGAEPTDLGDLAVSIAFCGWNLLPVLGAAALLLWAGRRGWLAYGAAALGSLALALLIASTLRDFWTSSSSTSALVFIFLPIMGWGVVGVTAGLVALARLRDSRPASARHGDSPGA